MTTIQRFVFGDELQRFWFRATAMCQVSEIEKEIVFGRRSRVPFLIVVLLLLCGTVWVPSSSTMMVAATSFRPRLVRQQTAFVVPNQKDAARPKANYFVNDAWFLHTSLSSMTTRRQGGTTIPILSTRPPPERQGSSRATVTSVAALPTLQESVLWASFPDVVASSSDTLDRSVDPALSAAPPQLSPEATVGIFLVGLLPFAVATVEFWRRIAVGASFGTGSDAVVFPQNKLTTIGQDNAPQSSRGRRILGRGALITAYVLFAVAAAVLALVAIAVLTSDPAMEVLPPPQPPLPVSSSALL